MRKNMILTMLLIASVSSQLLSQTFPDPEFSERPYLLTSDSSLKSLERVDAQLIYKPVGGVN